MITSTSATLTSIALDSLAQVTHVTDSEWSNRCEAMEKDYAQRIFSLSSELDKREKMIKMLDRKLKEAITEGKWCWLLAMSQLALRYQASSATYQRDVKH